MIKAPAILGCQGCFYHENNQPCPVDELIEGIPPNKWNSDQWPCIEGEYIWVEGNDDGAGEVKTLQGR